MSEFQNSLPTIRHLRNRQLPMHLNMQQHIHRTTLPSRPQFGHLQLQGLRERCLTSNPSRFCPNIPNRNIQLVCIVQTSRRRIGDRCRGVYITPGNLSGRNGALFCDIVVDIYCDLFHDYDSKFRADNGSCYDFVVIDCVSC